jgi:hypothetical protein
MDVAAGLNFAMFPTELLYIKIGGSVAHINKPKESFLNQSNHVSMRPTATVDALARVGTNLVINPSVYYTTQKTAWELMYGSLFMVNVGTATPQHRIIGGAYHRWNDAIVGVLGYEWDGLRIMSSYDYTVSELGQYIHHKGAFELSLRWMGKYKEKGADVRQYSCPRF